MSNTGGRILGALTPDAEQLRDAAFLSVWGRWFVGAGATFLFVYRPDYSMGQYIIFGSVIIALALENGVLHYCLRSQRLMRGYWFWWTSGVDIILITTAVIADLGFQSALFLFYYPALTLFGLTFASLKLSLAWCATAATIYACCCLFVGDGVDYGAAGERELYLRLFIMMPMALAGNWVTGIERRGRREAVERERALLQDRVELSQTIHDTTAQSAYMIGLGIDQAILLAGQQDEELQRTLTATSRLSKSAMWELRQPIDMGQIFAGRGLAQVLEQHATSFATITLVPAEFVSTGVEPPLSNEARATLFLTAHSALTNAHRHAQASAVKIELDFGKEDIRLSVHDDGIGLPEDYGERGHGFRNMRMRAERSGGVLIVKSGEAGEGTSVTCQIPRGSSQKGVQNDYGQSDSSDDRG